ncbi:hypothetical protein PISMIDRAFT_672260 [Pisolithus microcarpus 441]|uniref:Uncharacterized protein n=1 Tax=Pisolithus microcarpus 441 TaxID=765257 RepID=A0A0D0AC26_9AGAM|nr:hypothetical protein PISMIDRAFT_672260 [Pisolithus microcarpus 441]
MTPPSPLSPRQPLSLQSPRCLPCPWGMCLYHPVERERLSSVGSLVRLEETKTIHL